MKTNPNNLPRLPPLGDLLREVMANSSTNTSDLPPIEEALRSINPEESGKKEDSSEEGFRSDGVHCIWLQHFGSRKQDFESRNYGSCQYYKKLRCNAGHQHCSYDGNVTGFYGYVSFFSSDSGDWKRGCNGLKGGKINGLRE